VDPSPSLEERPDAEKDHQATDQHDGGPNGTLPARTSVVKIRGGDIGLDEETVAANWHDQRIRIVGREARRVTCLCAQGHRHDRSRNRKSIANTRSGLGAQPLFDHDRGMNEGVHAFGWIDDRFYPNEPGAKPARLDEERGRSDDSLEGLIGHAASPGKGGPVGVVDGDPRSRGVLTGERLVRDVEEPLGCGGISRRDTNSIALARDPIGNGGERAGAEVQTLSQLAIHPCERRLVGRSEAYPFEAPTTQPHGQGHDEPDSREAQVKAHLYAGYTGVIVKSFRAAVQPSKSQTTRQ
jgi:hypothetical protein